MDKTELVWQKKPFLWLVRRALFISIVTLAFLLCLAANLVTSASPAQLKNQSSRSVIIPPPPTVGFLFVVTSTLDRDNAAGGAVCDDGTGNCTLRAAIEVSNNNPGHDTIQFAIPTTDPGFDPATGIYTINLSQALPDLRTNIAILGPGADKLTVAKGTISQFRIFKVNTPGVVTISGLTIANGGADSGSGIQNFSTGVLNVTGCTIRTNGAGGIGPHGGGISNETTGTVNVNNSTISQNASAGNHGAGISNLTGTVNVTNSILSDNFAGNGGGAIGNDTGIVTITNSTLSGNTVGQGSNGGAIFNNGSGSVTLTNCTLSGNHAGPSNPQFFTPVGGGIFNNGAGTVTISNSTLGGNVANFGGAIRNESTGTINLTYSTVSGNSAVLEAGGIQNNSTGPFNVKSSIVAQNTAGVEFADTLGTLTSQGFNVVGLGGGLHAASDHQTDDPKIDSVLKNNGGPTQTLALLPGSIAINNGAPDAPARDQRGLLRQDAPDVGAFEFGGTFYPTSLANISTRGFVDTGDNVMIGGFIINGTANKTVLLRAIGPSLRNPPINLANTLDDPTLSLFSGNSMIASNDNWSDAANAQSIDPGLRPTNSLESAILISLAPGAYTAIVRGGNGGTGIGLFEAFDLDTTVQTKLSNISTRGLVETGDSVLIGGFIIKGPDADKVVVRAIGPSLANPPINLTNVLQNPSLGLFNDQGSRIQFNDDWQTDQANDIIATGLQPTNPGESAIVVTLAPGNYTAIVQGVNGTTGIALVEVYGLN